MKRKMKRLGDELETVSLWHKKKEALTELKLKILWSYVVEYEKVRVYTHVCSAAL